MKLSIITINWNNCAGLSKTLNTVIDQTTSDFEYIVVDGGSTDGSVDLIKQKAQLRPILWTSERDKGIYNGMNKGIQRASGDYIMILNSGDYLAADDVIERMLSLIESLPNKDIIYGNILKRWPDGHTIRDRQLQGEPSLFDFYTGTLNPDGTLISRSLFQQYGYFNEDLKICSDWAWFLNVVGMNGTKVSHVDIDTIFFDMTGVSEGGDKSRAIIQQERSQVLSSTLPASVLKDYQRYESDLRIMRRLHRHGWAIRIVRLIERVCFKFEKKK